MRKFLIITHGGFAKGIAHSLTLFIGENHPFHAISAYVDDTPVQDEIASFMATVEENDQLVVLTDIMGGSVNQLMMPYLSRPNTYILAGFNFPMLIELSCLPEEAEIDDFRRIINNGQKAIVLMNDYHFSASLDEGDE